MCVVNLCVGQKFPGCVCSPPLLSGARAGGMHGAGADGLGVNIAVTDAAGSTADTARSTAGSTAEGTDATVGEGATNAAGTNTGALKFAVGTHTCKHSHTRTHTKTHTHTRTHMHIQTHTHAHTLTCTHTHTLQTRWWVLLQTQPACVPY